MSLKRIIQFGQITTLMLLAMGHLVACNYSCYIYLFRGEMSIDVSWFFYLQVRSDVFALWGYVEDQRLRGAGQIQMFPVKLAKLFCTPRCCNLMPCCYFNLKRICCIFVKNDRLSCVELRDSSMSLMLINFIWRNYCFVAVNAATSYSFVLLQNPYRH